MGLYSGREICQETVYKMTGEKEEGNEAGRQGSRNVELNIKAQGDHVSDLMKFSYM